ncbi:hypothetical protein [uncultured Pseudokineococcus sp.]|uniref:hypothetical protein n=1 Tax=uncultured Pseudokineococcus sp. TaxID=1642928 RepID=UPI00261E7171|nr:hypothetical protein [uncultured Pseudokineococcus sp.]
MTTTPTTAAAASTSTGAAAAVAPATPGPRHVLGLATPHLRTPAEVDHAAARVAQVAGFPVGALVASTLVPGPPQHLGLVVLTAEPLPEQVAAAVAAAAGATGPGEEVARRAAAGDADRVARYPGLDVLLGVLPVAEVLRSGAVEALVGLGGLVVPDDAELDTRDHVRPRLAGGRMVLDVQPSRGGRWVPFEPPVQHACCSNH